MEPILNKQEIADLLIAIKEGRVSTDIGDPGSDSSRQQLNYTDIDIFHLTGRRDDTIRIPNFDIILDAFAQNYSISLSNQMQRTCYIFRTELESMPFREYMLSKKNPGSIGVLNLSPLKHGALMVYDPLFSFSAVEVMLGATSDLDPLQPDRSLTKIELTVLKSTMNKACADLDRAFRPITRLESNLIKIESNPRLVSITDPESEVIIGTFKVTTGEQTGTMELVFPLATLDPFREEFRDLLSVNTLKHGGWTDIIADEIKEVTTTVIAQSGTLDLTIGKVMQLKVGDIIPVTYDINSSLKVLVEEKLKFFAIPGTHNGKKAINLLSICE